MQISEFVEATSRLETYYDKEYTNEQRQIMFEELKDLEIDRYKFLISQAIRKCKYLPKVSEIFQIDSETQYVKSQKETIEKVDCEKCHGTGYIIYKKKIDNGTKFYYTDYAAVCECGNAKPYKGWEITNKEHRSKFYIPIIQELGLA